MHDFLCDYELNRNRLGVVGGSSIPVSQYTYDSDGNLHMDENPGGFTKISWTLADKVSSISGLPGELHFDYSPTGQRQVKRTALGSTYYIHDATGNVMATYTLKNNLFKVEDLYIYGSGRLGVYRMDDAVTALPGDSVFTRPIGRRQDELADHLGNVTVTLPDLKSVAAYSANYISYEAVYLSHTDYYPFGYPIAERSSSGKDYRYGFNGQEKDDEIYGKGSAYDFGERIYDSRIGRWFSIDPLQAKYPDLSPYAFTANNPIRFIDIGGEDFGIKINYDDKTIIIVANVHTNSEQSYNQVLNAANEWNKQTANVEGYTVSFQINIIPPPTVDSELVTNIPGVVRGNGKIKQAEYKANEQKIAGRFAVGNAWADPIGNSYSGIYGNHSRTVEGDKFHGGYTAYQKHISMNYHVSLGDIGNSLDAVMHELGHLFGLNDAEGLYFPPEGIMEYKTPMNSIHPNDINMVIQYVKDVLSGSTANGGTNAKVTIIEENGTFDENNPLGIKKQE
jgi:RHS repeat-associated protein